MKHFANFLYQAHGDMHLTAYSHRCEVCFMTFQKKDALTNHSRTHLNDTLHKCFVCEKTFPNEKVRDQHAAKHKGQLPHKCELCQMTFQSRSQLIRHATSHTKTGGCAAAATATAPGKKTSLVPLHSFLWPDKYQHDAHCGKMKPFGSVRKMNLMNRMFFQAVPQQPR